MNVKKEYTLEELEYIFERYVDFPPDTCTGGVCHGCVRIVIVNDEEGLAFETCNECKKGYCDQCYRDFMKNWFEGKVSTDGNIICDDCFNKQ